VGSTVRSTEDFPPELREAARFAKSAILHLLMDPEAATPSPTLVQIRALGRGGERKPVILA
jgi:acetolactate synthase I/II/III large subunit